MKTIKKVPWASLLIIVAILMMAIFARGNSASAHTGQVSESSELAVQLDAILSGRNFQGAVLVQRDGEVILRAAYGMACNTQGIPMTVYSPFHIASVTKNFTGAAILLLEHGGLLDTSDTLDLFFTGPKGLSSVSIAHLLAMRGGFYDFTSWIYTQPNPAYFEEAWAMNIDDIEAYITENYWRGAPQERPFYCNTDYWLLGRIIEQASGMPYEEFVASRLFYPADMTNSGFSGIDESVRPLGLPSIYVDGIDLLNPCNWPFFGPYSTGGLISTIDDINLWLDAYFGGMLFPMYLLDSVQVGVYNYGWMFVGDDIWHHAGGGMPGFSSHIIYDRGTSTRIILLSNHWRGVNASLVRAVTDAVLGVPVNGFQAPRG